MLVSRARKQAGALSSTLRELGCEVIEIPFIEIRKPSSFAALDIVLHNLANYDWLILTSVNGVEALFARMAKYRIKRSALSHLKIAAIGPATKSAIEKHGLTVTVTPKRVCRGVGGCFVAKPSEREARSAGAREGRARCDSARVAQGWSDSRCDRSLRNGGS